ncbi:MAG TPA: lipopolysaccharide assembly protein LapA domain-containing protein [Acidimicrobiales bacterium]|nr:lipopolysaccharide assembly protein LapA domain-containing protein [Acidimicrobiales bacterium]
MTPEPAGGGRPGRGRRLPAARLVGLAAVVAVVVSFAVENDQRVKVQLWFVSGHPRLVWVLVVTVVVSAALGYLFGRSRRRRRLSARTALRRSRSSQSDQEG